MSMSTSRVSAWVWPAALVLIVAMGIGAALYVFQTVARAPGAAVEEGRRVLEDLGRVAAAFRSGTVTTSFSSYATEVNGVSRLQLAELTQIELFEQTDAVTVLWGQLELPELIVRARVPVEYTYYVDLDGVWEFTLEAGSIRVIAPEIEFNPPALDVSRLEYEVAAESLLRDEQSAIERLQAGLTQMSRQRAIDNRPLVVELARLEVAGFVTEWLAANFVDGEDFTVDVRFADEGPIFESMSGRS